jgi:hypothetical protein
VRVTRRSEDFILEVTVWGMDRVCTHRIGGGTTEMQCDSVADLPFNQLKTNAGR